MQLSPKEQVLAGIPAYIDVGERTDVGVWDEPRFVDMPLLGTPPGLEKSMDSTDLLTNSWSPALHWSHDIGPPTWPLEMSDWMISAEFPWTAAPLLNGHPPKATGRSSKLCDTGCRQRGHRRTPLVLAQGLSELEGHDADCVIYVRGIHRLGYDSEKLLRTHYGRYGQVEKIFFSNAHELPLGLKRTRIRPSSIALILMARPEEARTALAAGNAQIVNGIPLIVRKFVHKDMRDSVCGPSSTVPERLGENIVVQLDCYGEADTSVESTSVDTGSNADDTRSSSSSNADSALLAI